MEQAQDTEVKLTREQRNIIAQQKREREAKEKADRREARNLDNQRKREEAQKVKDLIAKEKLENADKIKADKQAERDRVRAEKKAIADKEREEKRATKKAERELADAESKAQREADRQLKKEQKLKDAQEAAAQRQQLLDDRKRQIADRREATRTGERRPKATHFALNDEAEGLSSPQADSIRGKVLAFARENFAVGELVNIEAFDAAAAHLLYGAGVRSFLSKLEEVAHLEFHVVAADPEKDPESGSEDEGQAGQENEAE